METPLPERTTPCSNRLASWTPASSFDHETRQISVTAQTDGANSVTVLGAFQRTAENGVAGATRADMLDVISVSVAVVQHSLRAEDS